jgi:hypothetical protein
MRCVGVNSSPILYLPAAVFYAAAAHPLLSHNRALLIDTLGEAKQMWSERYILVSEGNV